MKAIILAAGRGSRMQGLTDQRPKCLVSVRGKPLLDWQRESLSAAGIDEIAIVTGYRREMLANLGMTEFHNPRWAETNMVSSLACAEEWLREGPCIVSYSDIFFAPQAVTALMHSTAALAVTYDPNWLALWSSRFGDPLVDAETFRLTPEGTLAEIGNKPHATDDVEGQYMGLLRFTPDAWQKVSNIRTTLPPDVRDHMHMTGTLQKLIESGHLPIAALPYSGEWGEVDNGDDLALYNESPATPKS